jgi:Ca2+-binding RTX toxin-like protein
MTNLPKSQRTALHTPPVGSSLGASSLRARRTASLVGAAAAALAFTPAAASAATTAMSGTTLTITDEAGHAGVYTVSELANPLNLPGLDKIVVGANTALNPAPTGCTHPTLAFISDPNTLVCDRAAVTLLKLDLGDGNDTVQRPLNLTLLGTQALPVGSLAIQADGGAGDDHLDGGDGNDVLDGGSGDDVLSGFGGNDTFIGGTGADTINAGAGTNSIDVSSPEADVVNLTTGSINTATASANDTFLGTGATIGASVAGIDVNVDLSTGAISLPSVPAITVPPVTVPAVTTPVVTTPEITVPGINVPPITVPEVTVPGVTVPAVTTPEITVPPITTPIGTTPEITIPSISTPEITTPTVTTPAITTPEVTTPEVTVPPVTVPSVTTPQVTTPAITTPEVTVDSPGATSPVLTLPSVGTPEVTITGREDSDGGTTGTSGTPDAPTSTTPTGTTPKNPKTHGNNTNTGASTGGQVDVNGIHLTVDCDSETSCESDGSATIDLGDGSSVSSAAGTIGKDGNGKIVMNLKLGNEYGAIEKAIAAGRCVVVNYRIRVKNSDGSDEVKSYAHRICGTKVTFSAKSRPRVEGSFATRRLAATVKCSNDCALTPRFLMVKSGNRVIARVNSADVFAVAGNGKVHRTIWKLSARQSKRIQRAAHSGASHIRYVVSTRAVTKAGISTTGSLSLRAARK